MIDKFDIDGIVSLIAQDKKEELDKIFPPSKEHSLDSSFFDDITIDELRKWKDKLCAKCPKNNSNISLKDIALKLKPIDKYLKLESSDTPKMLIFKNMFNHLVDRIGALLPMADIIDSVKELKLTKDDVDFLLNELMKEGLVFEPREGFIRII